MVMRAGFVLLSLFCLGFAISIVLALFLPQQMLIFAHFRLFDPLPGFSLSIGARNSSIGRYYRLQVRYGGLEGFGMGFGDGLMC